MTEVKHWTAARSGASLTISGTDALSGAAIKVAGVTKIQPSLQRPGVCIAYTKVGDHVFLQTKPTVERADVSVTGGKGPPDVSATKRFGCYVERNGSMIVFSSDHHSTLDLARGDALTLLSGGEDRVEIYEVETVTTRKLVETLPD